MAAGGLEPQIARWGVIGVLAFVGGWVRYGQLVGAGLAVMVAAAAVTLSLNEGAGHDYAAGNFRYNAAYWCGPNHGDQPVRSNSGRAGGALHGPAGSAGIPTDAGFAATLLILREFMHHLHFTSITIEREGDARNHQRPS